MTNIEALKAEMYPYELPEDTLEILLLKQGLQSSGSYSVGNDKSIIRAVIKGLEKLITLTKEKDNGSEIDYDVDLLKDLIKQYKKDIGEEEVSVGSIRDITSKW